MVHSQTPEFLWGDATVYIQPIRNRAMNKVLHTRTPCEALLRFQPDLSRIAPFGCLAYVLLPKRPKNKFIMRATARILIGIDENKGAYKIYVPHIHKVITSRNVKTIDNVYPYRQDTPNDYPQFRKGRTYNPDNNPIACNPALLFEGEDNEFDFHTFFETDPKEVPNVETSPDPQTTENQRPEEQEQTISGEVEDVVETEPHDEPDRNYFENPRTSSRSNKGTIPLDNDFAYPNKNKPASFLLANILSKDERETLNLIDIALIPEYTPTWKPPIKKEYQKMIDTGTFLKLSKEEQEEVKKQKKLLISTQTIMKIKMCGRKKARLVAIGSRQKYGTHYYDTYTPTSRLATTRLVLAIAAHYNWKAYTTNIENA
jgi:hypothetical protein